MSNLRLDLGKAEDETHALTWEVQTLKAIVLHPIPCESSEKSVCAGVEVWVNGSDKCGCLTHDN